MPFGDLAWNHVSHQLPGATETEIADAVADLLTRAHAGPEEADRPAKPVRASKRDRRVAARTKAAGPSTPTLRPEPAPQTAAEAPDTPVEDAEAEETLAEVIPLGLFDPREDPWRRT
ncbi:hypothetical protein ACFUCQ_29360 [Streptomyces sp. NPDC057197]|uniref:hypothetical protein n=1 Tax=Streptomyces sp. NPDC057197 TaxID=3346045 RepID=UPI00363FEE96